MQPTSESATVKAPPHKISPEEFAFETRFVVLNFLGQVQARTSSEDSFSSSGSGSGGRRVQTQSSSSSGSSHHARPSSVSPRPSSVSPRPPDHGGEKDSQVVGARAYDTKLKVIQAIAQKGKAQVAKERVNAEILQRGQGEEQHRTSDHITLSETRKDSTDGVDTDLADSRKRISAILEKKSREAKVIEELKNLATARIERIRASYETDTSEELDERTNYTGFDGTNGSGMLPQGGASMIPMLDDTPSPSLYQDFGMSGDASSPFLYGSHFGGSKDIPSPTRPGVLDGLHKTSDLLREAERSSYPHPGQMWPQGSSHSETKEESISKRDGIPRPPPSSREKSVGKRDGIPRPPDEKVTKDRTPGKRDGIPRPPPTERRDTGTRIPPDLNREFSRESEYSDMDSPQSDLSSLTWSGRSTISSAKSQRSSIVNMNEAQVKALVNTSVLPEVAVPLQEEITEQWQQWEREYEQAYFMHRKSSITIKKKRPALRVFIPEPVASSRSGSTQGMSPMVSNSGAMSPESEVARKLGIIGDRIQEEMGELLDKAFNDVMAIPREQVTYEVLTRVVEDDQLLQNSSGWKQVAVLLAFSQRLTMGLLQKGERGLGKLMDYSVRLIEDKAAEFIINQGGWGAISELDVSPLVSPVGDNPDFPIDASALPDVELPVEQIGMNAVGSLLGNPNERSFDGSLVSGVGGIYISDNFGSGAVGGIFHEGEGIANGVDMNRLVTDGRVQRGISENSTTGGSDHRSTGDVTPDLLKDGTPSSQEIIERVRPGISMMRSISHELTREAEEARTHRLITRLTWGSIAVVMLAVGLTLLWKWKPQNNTA